MDEDTNENLRNLVKWRKTKRYKATKLGNALDGIMKHVEPRQNAFNMVTEFFQQTLPAELLEHCKIGDIKAGQLKIIVDSPVYVHELRLCSAELLQQLQNSCRQAKIREIKFAIN